MSVSLFIKMSGEKGSLERLLETVRAGGGEIVDMTARRSLDNSCFFVRLGVQSETGADSICNELSALSEVIHLDMETAAQL